ncbi:MULTISPECIES: DUF2158 domain-containing protein [Alcaligenes]|uniref:DUF2158 domain-containing protein n=1 Tax=Alcaligenes TaxID=507 RepID=UPI001C833BC8|nr:MULTISPECIES: DUF2158 domain-containing protein [Alcaligenes]MBX6965982.1 DUF2158 domain-containing protein [Providencia rettgeri]MBX7031215.1 DUF2158 domain-containing protein [Alcaligenes faecalis]
MTDQIAPGNIVTLKSGGPKLTVEVVTSDHKASVSWFVAGEYNLMTIPVTALELVKD